MVREGVRNSQHVRSGGDQRPWPERLVEPKRQIKGKEIVKVLELRSCIRQSASGVRAGERQLAAFLRQGLFTGPWKRIRRRSAIKV